MTFDWKNWHHWLHGLIGAFIGGSANTITNMIVSPETFNLNAGLPKVLEAALLSGIISAALFLKQSPLPPEPPDPPKP